MFRTNATALKTILEQLEQATLEHAVWRDHLLRVFSGRRPYNPHDVAPDAHRHCLFGRWYFEQAPPELRELRSFGMIGAEHEEQHRIAASLLRDLVPGVPAERSAVESFEDASSRLSYALYFIRREIECTLRSRDALTDAHSTGEMVRDLHEWHALARQPGRQTCIALMELDNVREINATRGYSVGAQALTQAVKTVAANLRLSDKVFRYDVSKFLIRLSGTELAAAKTVIARLRETVKHELTAIGADGAAGEVTASFGIALLDPLVDTMESIDRADQALTLAKTAGGNRIIVWDPSVTTGVRLRRLDLKDVPS